MTTRPMAWRFYFLSAVMMGVAVPATAGQLEDGISAYRRNDFTAALRLWQPLADAGNAEAQDRLGLMYANGQGVKQDQAAAAVWFKKSAEKGNAEAEWRLAMYYLEGNDPLPKNVPLGLAWLQRSADQNFAPAEVALASAYGVFPELPRNPEKSLFWYRKAADQGVPEAMYQVGQAYNAGRGVSRDDSQAAVWFRAAAEKGYQGAEVGLGRLYAQGLGVPKDKDQALFWLRRAASRGGGPGRVADQLIASLQDDRTARSPDQPANPQAFAADMEKRRAEAEQGIPTSQLALGNYYSIRAFAGSPEDALLAMRWWIAAAEQGDVQAMNKLVAAYLLGKLVPRDEKQSASWARKAADKDDPLAELQLGRDYASGNGVPMERTQAIAWFLKAKAHGGIFTGWAEKAIADLDGVGRQ